MFVGKMEKCADYFCDGMTPIIIGKSSPDKSVCEDFLKSKQ